MKMSATTYDKEGKIVQRVETVQEGKAIAVMVGNPSRNAFNEALKLQGKYGINKIKCTESCSLKGYDTF